MYACVHARVRVRVRACVPARLRMQNEVKMNMYMFKEHGTKICDNEKGLSTAHMCMHVKRHVRACT